MRVLYAKRRRCHQLLHVSTIQVSSEGLFLNFEKILYTNNQPKVKTNLAEGIGFEPMQPIQVDGLANRCIYHSTNLPKRKGLLITGLSILESRNRHYNSCKH